MTSPVSEEIEAFLRDNTRTFLMTRRRDGWPTGYPMVGLWADGALWFNTYRKSAKVKNIERDPRVCCLVTTNDHGGGAPAVLVHGTAAVVDSGSPSGAGNRATQSGDLGTVPAQVIGTVQERLASGKRVMVRVIPERAEFMVRP
jgi:nitroimidazol reductase NimA-like FMN-containing flavoprotein (pyridoxamine 5'-phosphate oxidase superfamily)